MFLLTSFIIISCVKFYQQIASSRKIHWVYHRAAIRKDDPKVFEMACYFGAVFASQGMMMHSQRLPWRSNLWLYMGEFLSLVRSINPQS